MQYGQSEGTISPYPLSFVLTFSEACGRMRGSLALPLRNRIQTVMTLAVVGRGTTIVALLANSAMILSYPTSPVHIVPLLEGPGVRLVVIEKSTVIKRYSMLFGAAGASQYIGQGCIQGSDSVYTYIRHTKSQLMISLFPNLQSLPSPLVSLTLQPSSQPAPPTSPPQLPASSHQPPESSHPR